MPFSYYMGGLFFFIFFFIFLYLSFLYITTKDISKKVALYYFYTFILNYVFFFVPHDEEFLIALCLIFVFYLIYKMIGKSFGFFFFNKIEQIYLVFNYLILLNIHLTSYLSVNLNLLDYFFKHNLILVFWFSLNQFLKKLFNFNTNFFNLLLKNYTLFFLSQNSFFTGFSLSFLTLKSVFSKDGVTLSNLTFKKKHLFLTISSFFKFKQLFS